MSEGNKETLLLACFILIFFLLSAGDPDMLDALIHNLMKE